MITVASIYRKLALSVIYTAIPSSRSFCSWSAVGFTAVSSASKMAGKIML